MPRPADMRRCRPSDLEHCGGFSWALTEGLFGIDLFSDPAAAATIHNPLARLDPSWGVATAKFVLRGTAVVLTVDPQAGKVELAGRGPAVRVRVIGADGAAKVVCVGGGGGGGGPGDAGPGCD
eukprot:SAG22_NODE_23_length_31399_cov_35.631313_30_plen_123_part_00